MLFFWAVSLPFAAIFCLPWTYITKDIDFLYNTCMWVAFTGVRIAGVKVKTVGLEKFDPTRTYIFMSNHISNLDPPVTLPLIPRRTSVMVKKELFSIPILGRIMLIGSLVPVDRGNRDAGISAVRDAVKAIELGLNMTIYVEGHRSFDGKLLPFKKGPFYAGQLLFTGIISAERAQRVARTLLSPAAFGGWGIRTIGSSEARYNPMSYHNGSVWPHDNGLIAMGLARYGLQGAAAQVFGALFDAASYMDLRRLPELYCGFARVERNAPTQYPVACSPQAWASATPLALLQACLGLELLERTGEVKFYRPMLPNFLDHVHLRNLRLGGGSVDVLLHRHDRKSR